jgi:hypothetical protein
MSSTAALTDRPVRTLKTSCSRSVYDDASISSCGSEKLGGERLEGKIACSVPFILPPSTLMRLFSSSVKVAWPGVPSLSLPATKFSDVCLSASASDMMLSGLEGRACVVRKVKPQSAFAVLVREEMTR